MRKSVLMFETVVAGASVVLWGIMLAMSLGITYPNSAQFLTGGGSFPFLLSLLLIILNLLWVFDNLRTLKRGTDETAQPPLLTYLFGTKEQTRRLVLIALLVILYVFAPDRDDHLSSDLCKIVWKTQLVQDDPRQRTHQRSDLLCAEQYADAANAEIRRKDYDCRCCQFGVAFQC